MKVVVLPVTPYQQNCSLLWCESTRKAAVVDPGGELVKIITTIREQNLDPECILITHGHLDHAAGAADLSEQLGIPIIGPHVADKYWIDQLPETCRSLGFPAGKVFTPERWLREGDTISVGTFSLHVIHCPGHTPGHVVFHQRENKLALVGDVLFQGSIGRTDFPGGDYNTLIESIREKLFTLDPETTFIPGHGPLSTFGRERASNPFVGDHLF